MILHGLSFITKGLLDTLDWSISNRKDDIVRQKLLDRRGNRNKVVWKWRSHIRAYIKLENKKRLIFIFFFYSISLCSTLFPLFYFSHILSCFKFFQKLIWPEYIIFLELSSFILFFSFLLCLTRQWQLISTNQPFNDGSSLILR